MYWYGMLYQPITEVKGSIADGSTYNGISSNVSWLPPEITQVWWGTCCASGMTVKQSGDLPSYHVRGCGANVSLTRQGV